MTAPPVREGSSVDLSILAVNWNTRDLLLECLASAAAQDLAGRSFEIIVVDNASRDGSAEAVRARFPDATVIENRNPLGFTVAANQGLRACRGSYVMLTQPDITLPDPTVAADLMGYLETHPEVGVATPRYVNPDGSFQRMYNAFPTLAAMCLMTSPLARFDIVQRLSPVARYELRHVDFDRPADVPQPGLSCVVISRPAVVRVGLFDEQFPIYFSDVDWCFRAWQLNVKIAYLPRVRVVHARGASTQMMGEDQWRHSVASLVRYFRKHHGVAQTRALQLALALNLCLERLLLSWGEYRWHRRLGPRYALADVVRAIRGQVPALNTG